MTHKRRFIMLTAWHVFAITTMISSFVLVALVAYWTLIPLPNTALTATNFKISTPTVIAGDDIIYTFDYCKNHPTLKSRASVTIVNHAVIQLPLINTNQPVGCRDNATIPIPTPKFLITGTYHLEINVTYEYNPIHSESFLYKTPDFQIIGKE